MDSLCNSSFCVCCIILSIIVTSQIPVQGWYDVIGEKTIADAILDRLIHQSHRLELHGESMRKKRATNKE